MGIFVFLISSSLIVNGVFGDTDDAVSLSVMEGDSVTLHTGVVKHKDDLVIWCYGPENALVVKTNGRVGSTKYYEGDNGKFIGRVNINDQTGSLTITNMRTEHAGLYTLKISNKKSSYKTFNVTIYGVFSETGEERSLSVMERDLVTLQTDVIKQKDDVFVWYYGLDNTLVAKTNGKANSTKYYDGEDGKFKDRVMLDAQTGDLSISNVRIEHTGLYTLKLTINNKVSYKKYNVTVRGYLKNKDLDNTEHCRPGIPALKVIIISAVFAVLVFVICIIIIAIIIHKRKGHKGSLMKTLPAKVPLTAEERSINSSSSEETEDSGLFRGQHHC